MNVYCITDSTGTSGSLLTPDNGNTYLYLMSDIIQANPLRATTTCPMASSTPSSSLVEVSFATSTINEMQIHNDIAFGFGFFLTILLFFAFYFRGRHN